MGLHALLAPSSAGRWLLCTRSARAEESFPESTSDAAEEGTVAHSLGEAMIRVKTGMISKKEYKFILEGRPATKKTEAVPGIKEDRFYCEAMHEHCENYSDYVVERYMLARKKTSDAILFVERLLDMSKYVLESFGTGDVIIIADGTLEFIDLKYGKGVPVSAIGNKQLRMYALGAVTEFDFLYDISDVRMVIYQPRLDSVSIDTMSYTDLVEWGETILRPAAELAFAGEGEFVPGDHCRFCKVRYECTALAERNMTISEYVERDASLIPLDKISEILALSGDITKWLTGFKEYWIKKVLEGAELPNLKLVNGKGARILTDPDKIESILVANNYSTDKILKPKELYGITELTKVVGKKKLDELIGSLIVHKDGAPTLVSTEDSRPAFEQPDPFAVPFAEPEEHDFL